MSLEFILGGNTSYNQDVEAYYYAPLKEWEINDKVIENASNNNISVQDIKKSYMTKINKQLRDKEPNYINNTLWNESQEIFFGKDGTSDAYTKRGMDIEFFEYFDRQVTEKQAWRFETNDSYIDFKVGAKVIIGKKEFVIMKVINQLNIGNIPNFIKARPNMDLLDKWGVKTLILA